MKAFFGFALADSMFNGDCAISRRALSVEEVKERVAQGIESCCNPSHKATIDAMKSRYGIEVTIPETPPRVSLDSGDSVIVMGVRGLPRLTDRHEYTREEIAQATFSFAEYAVGALTTAERAIEYLRGAFISAGYHIWGGDGHCAGSVIQGTLDIADGK